MRADREGRRQRDRRGVRRPDAARAAARLSNLPDLAVGAIFDANGPILPLTPHDQRKSRREHVLRSTSLIAALHAKIGKSKKGSIDGVSKLLGCRGSFGDAFIGMCAVFFFEYSAPSRHTCVGSCSLVGSGARSPLVVFRKYLSNNPLRYVQRERGAEFILLARRELRNVRSPCIAGRAVRDARRQY